MEIDELLAESEGEYALQQLHRWLSYTGLTFLGGAAAFWLPYRLVSMVLIALAVLFAPYMLWKLYKARWFKSIAIFAVVVLLPIVVSRLFSFGGFLATGFPLAAFYVYVWVLRHTLGDYLTERRLVRLFEHEGGRKSV